MYDLLLEVSQTDIRLIHRSNSADDLNLVSGVLEQELNEAGTLTFSVSSENRQYAQLVQLLDTLHGHNIFLKSYSIFTYNPVAIWAGRVVDVTIETSGIIELECEGCLNYLKDACFNPWTYEGTVGGLLDTLVSKYNGFVSGYPQVRSFTVAYVNSGVANEPISCSFDNYEDAYSIIKENILDVYGGYINAFAVLSYVNNNGHHVPSNCSLVLEYSDYPTPYYLIPSKANDVYTAKFEENIISVERYRSAKDAYSEIIPLGASVRPADLLSPSYTSGYVDKDGVTQSATAANEYYTNYLEVAPDDKIWVDISMANSGEAVWASVANFYYDSKSGSYTFVSQREIASDSDPVYGVFVSSQNVSDDTSHVVVSYAARSGATVKIYREDSTKAGALTISRYKESQSQYGSVNIINTAMAQKYGRKRRLVKFSEIGDRELVNEYGQNIPYTDDMHLEDSTRLYQTGLAQLNDDCIPEDDLQITAVDLKLHNGQNNEAMWLGDTVHITHNNWAVKNESEYNALAINTTGLVSSISIDLLNFYENVYSIGKQKPRISKMIDK